MEDKIWTRYREARKKYMDEIYLLLSNIKERIELLEENSNGKNNCKECS